MPLWITRMNLCFYTELFSQTSNTAARGPKCMLHAVKHFDNHWLWYRSPNWTSRCTVVSDCAPQSWEWYQYNVENSVRNPDKTDFTKRDLKSFTNFSGQNSNPPVHRNHSYSTQCTITMISMYYPYDFEAHKNLSHKQFPILVYYFMYYAVFW